MTNDKKWTGGEWSTDTETYSDAAMIYGGDGYLIADMVEVLSHRRGGSIHDKDARDIDHEEVVANAHLLANAKRLYEALEAATALLRRAEEELRLIRMKECDRVYDVTLRIDMNTFAGEAALDAARGEK